MKSFLGTRDEGGDCLGLAGRDGCLGAGKESCVDTWAGKDCWIGWDATGLAGNDWNGTGSCLDGEGCCLEGEGACLAGAAAAGLEGAAAWKDWKGFCLGGETGWVAGNDWKEFLCWLLCSTIPWSLSCWIRDGDWNVSWSWNFLLDEVGLNTKISWGDGAGGEGSGNLDCSVTGLENISPRDWSRLCPRGCSSSRLKVGTKGRVGAAVAVMGGRVLTSGLEKNSVCTG